MPRGRPFASATNRLKFEFVKSGGFSVYLHLLSQCLSLTNRLPKNVPSTNGLLRALNTRSLSPDRETHSIALRRLLEVTRQNVCVCVQCLGVASCQLEKCTAIVFGAPCSRMGLTALWRAIHIFATATLPFASNYLHLLVFLMHFGYLFLFE